MANQDTKAVPEPNGSIAARPWYRLHVSTYVVLVLTATAIFLLNIPGERTAEFGLYPYEPWRDRTEEFKDRIVIFSGNDRQIAVQHLLVHGWPTTWLVRDIGPHEDPATGELRDTKTWSFSEDLRSFYPGALVVNSLSRSV